MGCVLLIVDKENKVTLFIINESLRTRM